MVRIKDLLRFPDVLLNLALLAPGQVEQHIEVITDNGGFSAHRLHRLELLELGFRLFTRFLAQLGLADLFGKLRNLVAAVVITAELVLDRLQLLIQIIFALGLFHLALHAPADAPLHLQHRQFAFHEGHDHLEPLERVAFDEQCLLVGNLGIDCGGNGIGQLARVIDVAELFGGFLAQLLVQLGIIAELLDHLPHHGHHFTARCGDSILHFDHGFDMVAA